MCHLGTVRRGDMRVDGKEETVAGVEIRYCGSVVFTVSAVAMVLHHIQNVRRAVPSPFSCAVVYRSLFNLAVWSIADVLLELCHNYRVS